MSALVMSDYASAAYDAAHPDASVDFEDLPLDEQERWLRAANSVLALQKPARRNGLVGRAKKLTDAQVRAIHVLHGDGWTHRAIAKRYDVSPTTIGAIVRGEMRRGAQK